MSRTSQGTDFLLYIALALLRKTRNNQKEAKQSERSGTIRKQQNNRARHVEQCSETHKHVCQKHEKKGRRYTSEGCGFLPHTAAPSSSRSPSSNSSCSQQAPAYLSLAAIYTCMLVIKCWDISQQAATPCSRTPKKYSERKALLLKCRWGSSAREVGT